MGSKGIDATKSKEFVPGPGAYTYYDTMKGHHPSVKYDIQFITHYLKDWN